MGQWQGGGTLHIPLYETPEETERKRAEAERKRKPPDPDNTWYADGEDWYSTRTPWD